MKFTNEQLRIFDLCFGCPEIKQLPNCILQKFRNEISTGKTDMVDKLTVKQANAIIDAHKLCYQKRTGKRM